MTLQMDARATDEAWVRLVWDDFPTRLNGRTDESRFALHGYRIAELNAWSPVIDIPIGGSNSGYQDEYRCSGNDKRNSHTLSLSREVSYG